MVTKTTKRTAGLRDMLNDRRRELQNDVHTRLRDGRTDQPNDGRDDFEQSETAIQSDISLSLLQMRAETLTRIDAALVRLDAGKYGICAECDTAISERRLRAMPFAVRCQQCEERREQEEGHAQRRDQRRGGFSLFLDASNP